MSDQPPKFTPEEAPTLEIGPEADLMSLSHDEQVEIALASLDELPATQEGEARDLVEGLHGQAHMALGEIAPDPDFLIVAPNQNPAVEERPTIIPEIPVTMEELSCDHRDHDSLDQTATRVYPPEFKYIGEFMKSPQMLAYENAILRHQQAVRRHLSGVFSNSTFPEPPHFREYFQDFLRLRIAEAGQPDLSNGQAESPVGPKVRPASQSGRYSLLLNPLPQQAPGNENADPPTTKERPPQKR